MGDFAAEPSQGHEDSQQILIEHFSHAHIKPPQGLDDTTILPPIGDTALVQTTTLTALVQTGTLTALVQTGVA